MKNYIEDKNVQKNRWWILTAIGMFTIMSTLDGSIVNIALPVMSRDLQIPMNQAEWVVSIYLMMICGLLLFFGRVDWIEVKKIRKPNGAKPGFVVYEGQKTVAVTPDVELVDKLRNPPTK